MFELLERGEVLEVPTDRPLQEQQAWASFRDVVLGLEYRKYLACKVRYLVYRAFAILLFRIHIPRFSCPRIRCVP